MRKYPVRSSKTEVYRLMRSQNRDASRFLSQINDFKVRKERENSEVSIVVEELKTLV